MNIIEKKRINSILFFASKSRDKKIDRLKLMKLMWLADRLHLNKYGRTIHDDTYFAIQCGPILSNAKDLSYESIRGVFEVDGYIIKAETDPNLDYFSISDIEIMNLIWSNYGYITPSKLVNYSHKFPEWKRFKKNIENGPVKCFEMIMDDFFAIPEDSIFQSLINLPKETAEINRQEYLNSNAIKVWLNS